MAEPELRLPAFEDRGEAPKPRRRAAVIVGSATFAIAGLSGALYLGTLGYDVRRNNMHDARLKGILVQTPTVYQVTEGLKEKAPLIEVVDADAAQEVERAVEAWGAEKSAEIRTKAGQWPQLRIYDAGDMMYFIYFDDGNVMRDYVYVSS